LVSSTNPPQYNQVSLINLRKMEKRLISLKKKGKTKTKQTNKQEKQNRTKKKALNFCFVLVR